MHAMNFSMHFNISVLRSSRSLLRALTGPLALVLLCLFPVSFRAAATEMPPEQCAGLLKQLQALRTKHPGLQSDFTEQKMSHLLNKPLTTEGSLSFTVPDKFLREVKGNNPSTTVSNGKVLWIYYPKFKTAEMYALGGHSFFDDSMQALTAGLSFEHFDEFYKLKAFREDGGYRLVLTPKRANIKRLIQQLTLWIDAEFTPLKAVLVLPKGDEVTTIYRNVVRKELPDSLFEFAPAADVQVTRPLGK